MKWEYKTTYFGKSVTTKDRLENLNSLGEAGWELVCSASSDLYTDFYFKRLKQ
jgi:hypothetical protein